MPKNIDVLGMKFRFSKIDPQAGKVEIIYYKKKEEQRDYIIMKAIVFPFINLLWGGTIIMVIGFLLSIVRRLNDAKLSKQ